MELEQLKSTWQQLANELARSNLLREEALVASRLQRTRSSLRPLYLGQVLQMLFALPFVLLAALLWSRQPDAWAVIVAGVLVHAYGVVSIVAAGLTLGRLHAIDFSGPVLSIQHQLAQVRRAYVISGMLAGLPWWLLWMLVLMVLAGLGGIDLSAQQPWFVGLSLAFGALGLAATAWFHRWARQPQRAAFGRRMDALLTGASLRRAQSQLAELERFRSE
ncbi:MAG: serine/threonine protein kinase [Xanthomonadales bacterium]|nr:serine/threonine protein kinase [Xanthomonadales bacterium]